MVAVRKDLIKKYLDLNCEELFKAMSNSEISREKDFALTVTSQALEHDFFLVCSRHEALIVFKMIG